MLRNETVTSHIQAQPKAVQTALKKVRETIRKAAPKAEETIGYGMPTYKLNGNLVHFAAFKNHIGFYPGPKAIEHFKKELAKFKTSKGAIQFPHEEKIPFGLITKIVKRRVAENKK